MYSQIFNVKKQSKWKCLSIDSPPPRHTLFVSILAWKTFKHSVHIMVWRHSMTFRDVTTWYHMTLSLLSIGQPIRSFKNLRSSTWRPWPLTYDLRTNLRYYQGTSLHQISGPYFHVFSLVSPDRHTHTHRYTYGTDFIPLTSETERYRVIFLEIKSRPTASAPLSV